MAWRFIKSSGLAPSKPFAEAGQKFSDQVWLRLARGSYLVARYKQGSKAKLSALSDGAAGFRSDDRLTLERGLAGLSFEAGDAVQAAEHARQACEIDPENLEARLFLFDLAFRNGDAAGVKRVLQEIRGLEGEGPFWHYGEASLCLLAKPASATLDEAAFEHISAAQKLRPGWSALSLLTAQIYDRQGQRTVALRNYLGAIELGERSSGAVRRAVELLYAEQRYPEADQLLRRLEQQPTLFSGDIERMASKVSAQLDDLDRAVTLARTVAGESRDWQDQVWLGQLQGMLGLRAKEAGRADDASRRFAEAEASLQRATQLQPEASEPWVALIRFYAALSRNSDAQAAIRQAKSKLGAQSSAAWLRALYLKPSVRFWPRPRRNYDLALSQLPRSARW